MGRIMLTDLAVVLQEKHGMSAREAQTFVSAVVNAIKDGLDADKMVKVRGLGTFKVVDVDARESVNVNTGERHTIDGHARLTFQPDTAMKNLVNKPFSLFETVVLNDGVEFADAPEAPESPEEPEMTETPEVTEIMETPEVTETPITSEALEIPEEPEAPEEPEVQEEPELTETPEVTETPEEQPELTETPEEQPVLTETLEEHPELTETSEELEILEETASPRRWGLAALLGTALIALLVGLAAGFFLGRSTSCETAAPAKKAPAAQKQPAANKPAAPKPAPAPEQPADTEEQPTELMPEEQPATQNTQPAAEEQTAAQGGHIWERYDTLDRRVHDGAYYIMGLDRMEKVRAGDNTRRIASRVFGGADMSCYIEVFNGITASTPLEEGMEIKVPKVATKKSVRKKLQQNNE